MVLLVSLWFPHFKPSCHNLDIFLKAKFAIFNDVLVPYGSTGRAEERSGIFWDVLFCFKIDPPFWRCPAVSHCTFCCTICSAHFLLYACYKILDYYQILFPLKMTSTLSRNLQPTQGSCPIVGLRGDILRLPTCYLVCLFRSSLKN